MSYSIKIDAKEGENFVNVSPSDLDEDLVVLWVDKATHGQRKDLHDELSDFCDEGFDVDSDLGAEHLNYGLVDEWVEECADDFEITNFKNKFNSLDSISDINLVYWLKENQERVRYAVNMFGNGFKL